MYEARELSLPVCDWCHIECEDPEKMRVCSDEACGHDGLEGTFCTRSCLVAAHG